MYFYDVNIFVRSSMSLVYGVSIFWINVILSMLSKKLKESKPQLNVCEKLVIKVTSLIRSNQLCFLVVAFVWALLVPQVLRHYGLGPYHLTYKGFTFL